MRELRLMWPRILQLDDGFCGLTGGRGVFCIFCLYYTLLNCTSMRLVFGTILTERFGEELVKMHQRLEDD